VETRHLRVFQNEFDATLEKFKKAVLADDDVAAIDLLRDKIFLRDMLQNKPVILINKDKSERMLSEADIKLSFEILEAKEKQLSELLHKASVKTSAVKVTRKPKHDGNRLKVQDLPEISKDEAYALLAKTLKSPEDLSRNDEHSFSATLDMVSALRLITGKTGPATTAGVTWSNRRGKFRFEVKYPTTYKEFREKVIQKASKNLIEATLPPTKASVRTSAVKVTRKTKHGGNRLKVEDLPAISAKEAYLLLARTLKSPEDLSRNDEHSFTVTLDMVSALRVITNDKTSSAGIKWSSRGICRFEIKNPQLYKKFRESVIKTASSIIESSDLTANEVSELMLNMGGVETLNQHPIQFLEEITITPKHLREDVFNNEESKRRKLGESSNYIDLTDGKNDDVISSGILPSSETGLLSTTTATLFYHPNEQVSHLMPVDEAMNLLQSSLVEQVPINQEAAPYDDAAKKEYEEWLSNIYLRETEIPSTESNEFKAKI